MNHRYPILFNANNIHMLLIINGTNRPGNKTSLVSKHVLNLFQQLYKGEVLYLSLDEITDSLQLAHMYDRNHPNEVLRKLQETLMIPAKHWILITPEYNGSYPGIVKVFLDSLSVNRLPETFHHKKIGLIGVSDGRAGNLRGMEHLSSVFNYLKMTVFYNKLPISSAKLHLANGEVSDETKQALHNYAVDFVNWL